jgi:hypothetical protein
LAAARKKYCTDQSFPLQANFNFARALDLPSAASTLAAHAQGLVNASLAASSWAKYESGWRAFQAFELYEGRAADWPLTIETFRRFAVWAVTIRKLQPSTVEAYCSALSCLHNLKGMIACKWSSDPIFKMFLKGAPNAACAALPKPNTRRVVTLPLLQLLGHRIALTNWDGATKQIVWTACTGAFFSSARLGEFLSNTEHIFDPSSTLLWSDIMFREDSVLLCVKNPKSGSVKGEFLDLFKFPGYNCCPVAAFKALRRKCNIQGAPASPVFLFPSGKLLTPATLNKTLSMLLQDMCRPGENSVSCHSFRAGIPTALSLFPDLVSNDEIKGWGRWQSDCYERYTRLKHDQKRKIFDKIAAALTSLHSPN